MIMIPASLFRRVFLLSLINMFAMVIGAPVHAGHRDPAPIPDEVITRFVGNQQQKDDSLFVALSRHLDEATDLLDKMNNESSGDKSDLATRRMLLRSNNTELGVIREELRSRFTATRARLSSMGLSEQVAAWDRLLAKAEERFERIGKSLEEVRNATDQ